MADHDGWLFPLALFLFSRMLLLVGLQLSFHAYAIGDTLSPRCVLPLPTNPTFQSFCCWDCGWFERIVRMGYPRLEYAQVLPLLPILGRGVSTAFGILPRTALYLVANLASLFSYVLLYRLFRRLGGTRSARFALAAFVAYPFHFFQAVGYAESLMVLASVWAISLAMERRHLSAGIVLGFGVLARHVCLFSGVGLLVAQLRQQGFHPRKWRLKSDLIGLVLPFVFLFAWILFLRVQFGTWIGLHEAREASWWGKVGRAYWGVLDVLRNVPFDTHPEYYTYMVFALLPLAGTIALCRRPALAELAAPSVVLLIVFFLSGGVSLGRYTASCWFAFLPLGAFLNRSPRLGLVFLAVLFALQGYYFFYHPWGEII